MGSDQVADSGPGLDGANAAFTQDGGQEDLGSASSNGREKTGAAMYGPDISLYPSKLIDVITTLEREVRKETHERYEAEELER